MTIKLKVSSNGVASWKNVSQIKLKVNGVWRNVSQAKLKVAGAWRNIFSSSLTPSIQTRVNILLSGGINASSNIMNDSNPVTITSTRFHWEDADGYTYVWQKSADNLNWEDIGTAQSTTNPASGSSSSSLTLTLSPSYFTSGPDMYFRFSYRATNSTYNTSASSESLSKLVSYYGTPVPQSPYPEISGSTTVGNIAYGDIGVWTNSPTSYSYRWFFNSGLSSYPLTFSQSRSVLNKSLSGFTATITTSVPHGYKESDIAIITSMDSLFNKSSATMSSVTSNSFSYSINPPTAWANAGTAYSSGTYVSYSGSVYMAASTFSGTSIWNGGTLYSSGTIVYFNNNRYQSKLNNNIGNSVTNTTYWNDLGNFSPSGSLWTLQNFSNVLASGTTTGPNYYEGTSASTTSIALTTPTTDYKTSIDLRNQVLGFGVKAYNTATPNPSEYIGTKFIYGYPVITLGTPTYPSSTTAQIPFTSSYAAKYSIDVTRAGTSLNPYPLITTPATSPINISGMVAGLTYTVNVYPANGENLYGALASTTITLPNAPGPVTNLARTLGNGGSKTFTWSAPTSGGAVVSYEYQLNALGWVSNGASTSISLTGLSGSNTFQVRAVGSSLTGTSTSTGSFTIPTINSGPSASSVTFSSANISWTSSNQNSWSLSGVGSYSGSSETSQSVSLSASSSYTPTLTITSTTGDTVTRSGTAFSTPAQQFTVTFIANGGSGSMAQQSASTATNLSAFSFTPPAGKGFSGWATSSSGSVVYINQQSYPFNASITLYAIYYTLPTPPSAPSPSVTSGPTQISATVSWSAPADGGAGIIYYEAQLNNSGYSNIGNVLSQNLSGLSASTNYTYSVRAVNPIGTGGAGSVSFTTQAAPVIPSVTQIQSTNTNAGPTFMRFVITCANAASCDVRVDRAASSATAPTTNYTPGASTLLTLSGGSGTVNSTTTAAPAGSNAWYRIRVIPYTGASRTGTAGTQVASSWKRNTATSTTTTNPSPTPFGDAST
jgi:hypothetical protein